MNVEFLKLKLSHRSDFKLTKSAPYCRKFRIYLWVCLTVDIKSVLKNKKIWSKCFHNEICAVKHVCIFIAKCFKYGIPQGQVLYTCC